MEIMYTFMCMIKMLHVRIWCKILYQTNRQTDKNSCVLVYSHQAKKRLRLISRIAGVLTKSIGVAVLLSFLKIKWKKNIINNQKYHQLIFHCKTCILSPPIILKGLITLVCIKYAFAEIPVSGIKKKKQRFMYLHSNVCNVQMWQVSSIDSCHFVYYFVRLFVSFLQ